MYLSQSLCVLYSHNLNKCCTEKKIMILQLFILISGQIFKMFQYQKETKKAFEMLLETEIKNTICTADQKESRLLRYLVG